MDIRNCANCGGMFQYVGSKICPKCQEALEDKLQEVKKYIEENKGCSVMQCSEECDVAVKQIHRWIREDRLMFAPGVDTGLVCTKCGMPIEKGSLCKKCSSKLKDSLQEQMNANKPNPFADVKLKSDGNDKSMHLSRFK